MAVSDPANPIMFTQVRGRVVGMTSDGGEESIDSLAHKYTGQPYAWYGGHKQTRLIVSIEADRITSACREPLVTAGDRPAPQAGSA